MNIFVVTPDGNYSARPDTTLERECKDFYLPDDCESVRAFKCRYIKVKKAGKAVAERFAERYIEGSGAGMILYGVFSEKDTDGNPRMTPYIDGSTIINPDLRQVGGEELSQFAKAISFVTAHTSIRIGDYICLEEAAGIRCGRGDVLDFSETEKLALL